MRVLMLNYEFPPLGGGAANATRYLLEQFAGRDNVTIDLVTSSAGESHVASFAQNVTIYRLDVSKDDLHYWTQAEVLRYSLKSLAKVRKLRQSYDYNLVHAWFGVPCGVLARIIGLPYLVALRGSDVPGYSDRFTTQYVVLRPILRHVWREAEAVVANSQGLRELARETADPGISVIPNGVAVSEFTPEYDRSGQLHALCVARLVKRKGVRYLLEAIAEVAEVHVTVVGDGDRRGALERRAETLGVTDRTTFTGRVPHEEVHEYYREADVFVLPSFSEGMSNTVLEAMAAGLPIVTTDTGGTAELLDGNGTLIQKRNAEHIAGALETYLDDEETRRRQGRRSRELAEQMSWESVAFQYEEVYEEIC